MNVRSSIVIAVSVVALGACESDLRVAPSAAPAAQDAGEQVTTPGSTGAPGRVVACERRAVASDSAIIGPAGGVLRVGANELVVPAGALIEPVMIRGEVPDDTIASIRLFPAGLTFRRPAALVLDASGCAVPGSAAKIIYLDDGGTVLEEIDAIYYPQWKRVAAPIDHFSRYALAV